MFQKGQVMETLPFNPRATHHVLLIEDNQGDVQLVSEVLAGRQDIQVLLAENLVQAFRILSQRGECSSVPTPSLILLDLHLPVFSGKILLEERRHRGLWPDIPIVVFTSSQLERSECMRLDVSDYVVKPADWQEWQSTFHRIIDQYLR